MNRSQFGYWLFVFGVAVFAFVFGYLAHQIPQPGAFLSDPPKTIYISHPVGHGRDTERLEVIRVAPNDDPFPVPSDAWRVILETPSGSKFAECRHTGTAN